MKIVEIIEILALVTSIILLSLAAYSDIKKREVSDKLWLIYFPLAVFYTVIRLASDPSLLTLTLMSISIIVIISFSIFYLGLFGGADLKAFVCLGVALPFYPLNFSPLLGSYHSFYPLTILYHAYFFSVSIIVYNVSKNIVWTYKSKKVLFEGLKKEPLYRKMLAVLTGYKVEINTLREKIYLYPMEEISNGAEKKIRKLTLNTDIITDRHIQIQNLVHSLDNENINEVWVTPAIPLLFFVTIAFISNLIVGDILFWSIFTVISTFF